MHPHGDARTLRQPMAVAHAVQPAGYPVAGGMAMAPSQMGMTGMQHIASLPALEVQEKANMLQEISAMVGMELEMANKYNVLDGAGNKIFFAIEETNCCKRQLQNGCCHDCAPYDVNILYTP